MNVTEGDRTVDDTHPTSHLPRRGEDRQSIWELMVWAGVCCLLAFSVAGTTLAVAGWFRPLPTIIGTFVLAAASFVWIRPTIAKSPAPIRPHWALTLGVVILAAACGLWNGAHHGEHLIAERDPGVYAATGLWLANEGNLRIAAPEGPFHEAPGIKQDSIGFSPNSKGSLDAQFVHLNAVFLAGAAWLGPTKLFMIPALLMATAVVLVYALGTRLGHPFGGAYGALALAVSYPAIFLARDTYSEPVALVLLLSGLWGLTFVRRSGIAPAVVAGLTIGATCLARVDAYVPLIPIASVIALEATVALGRGERRRAWAWGAAWLAIAAGAVAGALEAQNFSRSYFNHDLAPRLPAMAGAIFAATIVGALVGRFGIGRPPDDETAKRSVRVAYSIAALGVVGLLVWARFIRPDFAGLRSAMRTAARTADLDPWTKTISYFWLEWYLGPLLVAGGFAALLWMIWKSLRADDRIWLMVAGVGFSTTLLYLFTPSITPDQPWATRRFMAVPIPILLLAAGIGISTIAKIRRPWSAIGAAIVGLAALITPIQVSSRLANTSVGGSLATRFDQICTLAHEQPSAILVASERALSFTIPETLGGWCDVPVAGAGGDITADDVHDLARQWQDEGRRLLLVATSEGGIAGVSGPSTIIAGPALIGPDYTIDRVPRRLVPDPRVAQSPDGELPLFVIDVEPPNR